MGSLFHLWYSYRGNGNHHQRKTLPSLERLVKQRRFDEIIEILQLTSNSTLSTWLGVQSSFKQQDDSDDGTTWMEPTLSSSALHLIVLHNPTVAVVDALLDKLTELKRGYIPEAAVDESGRTVLHTAVEVGCDVTVIRRLTLASELAVFTLDSHGRYPLHYAAMGSSTMCSAANNSSLAIWRSNGRAIKDNAVAIVNHLVQIYPKAAAVADADGKTPFALALEHGADSRIVSCLGIVQQVWTDKAIGGEAITASTTDLCDVPFHVNEPFFGADCGDDDVSSVGSRGISRHRRLLCI